MSDESKQAELEKIAMVVMEDPGAPGFALLAEAHRGIEQFAEAERILEAGLASAPGDVAGHAAAVLLRLDLGDLEGARARLLEIVARESRGASRILTELADSEIDLAFEEAEAEPDQMIDADDVAQQAMRGDALDEPEPLFEPEAHPAFATETMAGLLEMQGDATRAESIRTGLGRERLVEEIELGAQVEAADDRSLEDSDAIGTAMAVAADRQERKVSTLEGWLRNLQDQRGAQ